MLGSADLQDWADEGDLVRAEIRLLPIVARFASDRGPIQMTLEMTFRDDCERSLKAKI